MAAPVTSGPAARATSASAPPAIAITTTAGTAFASTFRTRDTRLDRCHHSVHPVEIWLIVGVEIRATFDYRCGRALRQQWSCRGRFHSVIA